MSGSRKIFLLIFFLLLALPMLVYLPGLGGVFLFDDYPNIIENEQLQLDDYSPSELLRASVSTGISGPLRRPISMLSFALNLEFCGQQPFCFKMTNLLIHIFCWVLIFLIATRLFRRQTFA